MQDVGTQLRLGMLSRRLSAGSIGRQLLAASAVLATAVAVGVAVRSVPAADLVVIPLLLIAAAVCARRPAGAMKTTFFLCGMYGSLTAFFAFPGPKTVDLLLVGLWLAAIWTWIFGSRIKGWILPSVALLLLYIGCSVVQLATNSNFHVALQDFRGSIWYLAAALLVAYAPWRAGTRRSILHGVLVVAALVGAYATFRWITGPAAQERTLGLQATNNVLNGGLRPIGSFPTSKELSAWTAAVIPFCLACTFVLSGRWRYISAIATVSCIFGLLAADVRAGAAAAVISLLAVLIMYAVAPSMRGRGITMTAGVFAGTAGVVVLAYVLTLAGHPGTSSRYAAILHPGSDASYQARLIKWRAAVKDTESHPLLGEGLGTAARTQQRFGRFLTIGSIDIDSAYLNVAFEQGFVVAAIYVLALVSVMLALMRRALTTSDRVRAGVAMGACGTLIAMLVLFFVGTYNEGLQVLAGWIVVGLGISQFVRPMPEPGLG
jgi:O-Antigen ligase